MPNEVRALGESLSAFVARVGALPSVRSLVPDEMGALAEGFPAVLTLVGLGSSVSPKVLGDGRAVVEGPSTLLTLKWPLSSVESLMLCEGGALNKCLPTVLTHVRLLSRVDFFMYREISWIPESFATFAASADLAPFVDSRECDLLSAPDEGSPTTPIFSGFLPFVALLMNFYTRTMCHLLNH